MGASLFDDNNHLSQPTTPVLYNLIRNEGPPKFIIATSKTPEPTPLSVTKENNDVSMCFVWWAGLIFVEMEEFDGDMVRGHPSACLFVAR